MGKTAIVISGRIHWNRLKNLLIHASGIYNKVILTDHEIAGMPKGFNISVISCSENYGKGVIQAAAHKAQQLGMTHIVTIDADTEYDPKDFLHFVSVLQEDTSAIVVGKRHFQKNSMPLWFRWTRIFFSLWLRLQTGQSIGDPRCNLRAYPVLVLESLNLCKKSHIFETEVLVRAAWAGVKLREADISASFQGERKQISGFRTLLNNFQVILLNLHLAMLSVIPFPHRKFQDNKNQSHEKISVLHPLRSLKALLTENVTPKQLALAGALGIFLGALPLIACHTIVILFAAGFFRLNKIAALGASQLCMPPVVPALCIETGYYMRHGRFLTEISMKTLGYQAAERFYEWLIGSVLLGPVMAFAVGALIYVMALFINNRNRNLD